MGLIMQRWEKRRTDRTETNGCQETSITGAAKGVKAHNATLIKGL